MNPESLKRNAVGKLAFLLLMAGFGPAALAATRASVEQVEQLLAASHNLPDAKLAEKLSGLELVERASSARLAQWQSQFAGARTREALLALADASAFLDLPAQDVLPKAEPDAVATKQIFVRAIAYANKTVKKLPNFSAKRNTIHFDNVSPAQRLLNQSLSDPGGGMKRAVAPGVAPALAPGLSRFGDETSVVVTYRDGEEVADAQTVNGRKPETRGFGLTSYGEFGPILSIVIADTMHGKVYWGHWEQGESGPVAVFQYLVSQEISHFTVIGGGNMTRSPSYHGEIAVDPTNGTILRITMASDWKPPFQPSESDIQVEYAPVQIGSGTYICPVHGVALSRVSNAPGGDMDAGHYVPPTQTYVNDVTFTEYHVFRGEIRILPAGESQ
jgi:hypothetical protein